MPMKNVTENLKFFQTRWNTSVPAKMMMMMKIGFNFLESFSGCKNRNFFLCDVCVYIWKVFSTIYFISTFIYWNKKKKQEDIKIGLLFNVQRWWWWCRCLVWCKCRFFSISTCNFYIYRHHTQPQWKKTELNQWWWWSKWISLKIFL